MEPYIPNREKYDTKYKLIGIKKAMAEMDEYISNPVSKYFLIF